MKFFTSKLPQVGKCGLFALLLLCFSYQLTAQSNSYLSGTVKDQEQSPLIGASVKAFQGNVFVRGAITDFDGNYRIALDSGLYSIEVGYTGLQTQRLENVKAIHGRIIAIPDFTLSNAQSLSEVVITAFKVPLIEQDKTSTGQTLTSDQIKNLPTRSTNSIVATTAGSGSVDGGKVNIKGSRSNAANKTAAVDRMKKKPAAVMASKPKSPQPAPKNKVVSRMDSLPRDYSAEQYNQIIENPFQDAESSNISTFSIDVDVASYTNIRRHLNYGSLPPKDAVRIEEMLNYFDYQYTPPVGPHPFEANVEVAPCPWNPDNRLLMIGLQGLNMDIGQLPASNFVFLIDVSGSMVQENKLPLVQQSLIMLTDNLRANDRVAIVVYAGAAGLVLESTPGTDKAKIKAAIQNLRSGGSTAGGAGITLAYETALKNFAPAGNNRVVLCTDGDFNIGVSTEDDLVKLIEKERESGIYLSILGFGMGNYQDGKMQMLADKGNGNHAYIDQLAEAKKVLIKEFGGTLFAIAKDVKLQLHFNPEIVAGYRLIGYENRMLATEDFNDDTKDAGELGVGHRVTALYELIPKGQQLPELSKLDSALVVVQQPDKSVKISDDDLLVLQLRYKKAKGKAGSQLMEYRLNAAALDRKTESANFKLASAIAEFGMLLRDSKYKGAASYAHALAQLRAASNYDPNGYRAELAQLIETAGKMAMAAK